MVSDLYRVILASINIITNLLILLLALGVLAIGIAGLVLVNTQLSTSDFIVYINSLFILVILIGFFISLICIFGVVGSVTACNSNSKILKIVSVCLLLLAICGMILVLIGEIAGVVLALKFRSQVTSTFSNSLLTLFNDTFANNPSSVDDLIVPIQTFFDCCGVNGPIDYRNIPAIGVNRTLPGGCCRSMYPTCTLSDNSDTYRPQGCASIVIAIITVYLNVVIGVGIVIFVLSIAAIVMPLLLMCAQCFKEDGHLRVV